MKQSKKNETIRSLTIMRKPAKVQTNLVLPAFKYDKKLFLNVFSTFAKWTNHILTSTFH